MKVYLRPGEKFYVIRSGAQELDPVLASDLSGVSSVVSMALIGDDVVVSAGGSEVVNASPEDGQVAEFLLGVSVEDGRERLLPVSIASAPLAEWQGAVALEVLRELRRERDVFVLHGVVNRVGGVESVTVWSAEVHVTPARVELFEGALARTKVKFEAQVQGLAEFAWAKVCGRDGVTSSVPVTASARAQVSAAVESDGFDESMLWMPEGYEEVDAAK
ncbi:hypothetical protein Q0M94_17930 (plasmid) [Deinococcus radiomollis]|uniref:hypothetical protein n=1 Tax=Deinococcus radiomollis TaxID=468916 RepID=UPI00389250FE